MPRMFKQLRLFKQEKEQENRTPTIWDRLEDGVPEYMDLPDRMKGAAVAAGILDDDDL